MKERFFKIFLISVILFTVFACCRREGEMVETECFLFASDAEAMLREIPVPTGSYIRVRLHCRKI